MKFQFWTPYGEQTLLLKILQIFAQKFFFVPKMQLILLYRGVWKWTFVPTSFFITLL